MNTKMTPAEFREMREKRKARMVAAGLWPFQLLVWSGLALYILAVFGTLLYLYTHGYGDRVRLSMYFKPLIALALWLGSVAYTRTWCKLLTLVGGANIVAFLLHPRFDFFGWPFLLSYALITLGAGVLSAKMKDPIFEQTTTQPVDRPDAAP